jgi:Ser/Thr protein kinase RdoA (MazF antagonist)
MDEELVGRVLEAYGVKYTQLLPTQKGYRNENHPLVTTSGGRLNLIIYKREPGIAERIRRANNVADTLAAQGFPARCTHDPRIIRLYEGKYAALYKYLPGTTIPWEAYTMKHLKALGTAMGDMHNILHSLDVHGLPGVADEYIAIVSRMRRYFSDPDVKRAMKEKLGVSLDPNICNKYSRILQHCRQLPGQQVLHMDFVRGNVLFAEPIDLAVAGRGAITGVLDFEKVAIGHPLFDIARTYAFLLVDCKHKTPAEVKKYFLQSGYSKHSRSPFNPTSSNERLLLALTDVFLLYDFYKFLRHNPYEYLHENEHYIRTQALLLGRGLLGFGGTGSN